MGEDTLFNLWAFALQVCVIAGVAAVLLAVLRIAPAGARYLCWRLVLITCLVMPLLLHRTAAPVMVETPAGPWSGEVVALDTGRNEAPETTPTALPQPALPWSTIATLIIGMGVAMRGSWLVIGLARLRALRRRGTPTDGDEYVEIQRTLGTRAQLLSVPGLTQPATFGLWRPVVLLPDTLAASPEKLRRAVVTHELFHVQRYDWSWVLVEESLRTVLWFHPAIAWLTSRIQLAREELVDELTVLATGNRKAYIEALVAFADAGRMRPAPAFARRRHLFTRIVRLSKESVMSSPRIVISATTVIAAVLGAGLYASSAFPIVSAAAATSAPQAVPARVQPSTQPVPARDERTWDTYLRESQESLRVLAQQATSLTPQGARGGGAARPGPATVPPPVAQTPSGNQVTPENPIPRRVYSVPVTYPQELQGSGLAVTAEVRVLVDANGVPTVLNRFSLMTAEPNAGLVATRVGPGGVTNANSPAEAFRKALTESISQWRYDPPAQAPLEFSVAVAFAPGQDGVVTQSAEPRGALTVRGPNGGFTTFRVNGTPIDARMADLDARQAELMKQRAALLQKYQPNHPDVVVVEQRLAEVAAARARAVAEVQTARAVAGPGTVSRQPLRVGGNIAPPQKIKDVAPEYPPIAQSARVQGVVIMEVTIDENGRVADARVLRSIPLLDQAALDAVRQWEYTPTLLNGAAVPILMTVTVNFSLQETPVQ